MDASITALSTYFKKEIPELKKSYSWKIPQIDGFKFSGQCGYEANIELKRYFNNKWHMAQDSKKIHLAKEVVADWGGVRANKDETLKTYLLELTKDSPKTPLKGIASYSKIFSIVDMEKYAIYDARVAACLNAVQWNAGVTSGLAFNYISGRNKTVGHSGKKIGFVHQERFKVGSLVKQGWTRIKRDDTYRTYLETLGECLKHIPSSKLYDLEMVLFANAETECSKAMKKINIS